MRKGEFTLIMLESNYGYGTTMHEGRDVVCPVSLGDEFEEYQYNDIECNHNPCDGCWKLVLDNYPWKE